jgi:predicted nucleic acid-binding protein
MYVGWGLDEAAALAVDQIGKSGCGVTSLHQVLVLLGVCELSVEGLEGVDTSRAILRTRANHSTSLNTYLKSRWNAGCTGEELCVSMERIKESNRENEKIQRIQAEFTPYQPDIHSDLIGYLKQILSKKDRVVVMTMNLQLIGNDAWHHHTIFAVDDESREIFCFNPFPTVYPEEVVKRFISTDSVLLIRSKDVLSRTNDITDADDREWGLQYRVKEQVDRLFSANSTPAGNTFVTIPAAYRGGIAIFQFSQ